MSNIIYIVTETDTDDCIDTRVVGVYSTFELAINRVQNIRDENDPYIYRIDQYELNSEYPYNHTEF